ncbi:hypothetical protein ACXR2U_21035 [Jatrophihabitans sp. YIM 134969]
MADDPTAGVDPTDVTAVADVLYRLAPEVFTATRTAFVKAARAAGRREVAAQIQGFGRPTRAAWVLNGLARGAPDVVAELVELGRALTEAQADLDATSLRELSDQRRALVRDVSRQAFELAGETSPSSALAVEVQDTLTAAVVDPAVGEALQAGGLLKAAQASGFGPAGPEIASVPPLRAVPTPSRAAAGTKATAGKPTKTAAAKASKTAPAKESAAQRRAQEQARKAAEAAEAQRRARVAAADQALKTAQADLEAARDAEKAAEEQVRILREQVRDADRALGDAGLAVREARAAVRAAERARRETR